MIAAGPPPSTEGTEASIVPRSATAVAIFLLVTNLPVALGRRGALPTAVALLVPGLLAVAVTHQVVVRRRGIVVDRTLLLMLGFLAVFLLSSFTAMGQEVALNRIGLYASEGMLLYFLARNAIRTLPELHTAVVALLIGAGVLAALAVAQAVTGQYDQDFLGLAQRNLEHLENRAAAPATEMGLEDRARGPVDDPNRFAQILLLGLPLGWVLALNALRKRAALVAGSGALLLLAGVLLTYSRGAFVTLVVLSIVAAFLRLVRPRRLAFVLGAGLVLTPILFPGYATRVQSIAGVADLFGKGEVEADGATTGRTTEMLAALAAYVDHPVLGVGPGQYLPYHSVHYQSLPEISIRGIATPRRAHSLYLELAAELGTVGLTVFLVIPLLLLRDLESLRRELSVLRPGLSRLAAGFILGLLGYLGTAVFLHLSFERYYWFFLALTAASVAILDREAAEAAARADARRRQALLATPTTPTARRPSPRRPPRRRPVELDPDGYRGPNHRHRVTNARQGAPASRPDTRD